MTDFACNCDAIVKPQFHPPTRNLKTKIISFAKTNASYLQLAFQFQLNIIQIVWLCCLNETLIDMWKSRALFLLV